MKRQTSLKLMTGVLAFIVLGFVTVAMACKDEPEPLLCKCEVKDHLGVGETCCKAEDCECGLQVYGNIVDYKGNEIPIYRKGNVVDEDMETAVAKAKEAYASLNGMQEGTLLYKLVAVYIIPGNDRNRIAVGDGTYIVELGEERSMLSMNSFIGQLANDIGKGLAKAKSQNTRQMLALEKQFNCAKQIMCFNTEKKFCVLF